MYGNEADNKANVMRVALIGLVAGLAGGLIAFKAAAFLTVPEPVVPKTPPAVREDRSRDRVDSSAAVVSPAVSVAERVAPAVVGVTSEEILRDFWTREEFAEPVGSGSGVIFDRRGYIVTNYHVISNADRVRVVLSGGRDVPAKIRGVDPATDLAVLQIDPTENLPVAELADSDGVKVGELAIAIGNPLGMEFARSVTVGVVSGIRSLPYGQGQMRRVFKLIQTDAAINPGNSGGALVNSRGQVIGINTFKFGEQNNVVGMGFAIPSNTVKRVIADLVEFGRVPRAVLGVSLVGKDEAQWRYGVNVRSGVLVGAVATGSPADRAGLQAGDIIVSIGGMPVDDFVDAVRILEDRRPGDRVAIRFVRDGREVEVAVRLTEMSR